MSERERQQLDTILASIARYSRKTFGDRLESVILYGSYARGDYDTDSDIDVMVLVRMEREALRPYEDGFDALSSDLSLADDDCTTISLILESSAHFHRWLPVVPFYKNVAGEGVRIHA